MNSLFGNLKVSLLPIVYIATQSLLVTHIEASVVGWWGFEDVGAESDDVVTSSENLLGTAGTADADQGTVYYSDDIPAAKIYDPITGSFYDNYLSSIAYNDPSRYSQNLAVEGSGSSPLNTQDFTLEFFVRQNQAGQQFSLLAGRLNTDGWGLQHGNDNDSNNLRARFRTSVSSNYFIFTDAFLGDDAWHHVALNYRQILPDDPATTGTDEARGEARVYVDYIQQGDPLTILGTVETEENLDFLKPGSFSTTSSFQVAFDEVRYHDKALDSRDFLSLPLPFPNGDFEQGATSWNYASANGMIQTVSSPTHGGSSLALKVTDNSPSSGANIRSAYIPTAGPDIYLLKGWIWRDGGSGAAVDVTALDQSYQPVLPLPSTYGISGTAQQWQPFSLKVFVTHDTYYLQVRVITYTGGQSTFYLDDLELVPMNWPLVTPWEGTYKIHSTETVKLTDADIVGPDGFAYPDWTQCGVQGGIPTVSAFATIEDYGGVADDGNDDSSALQAACDAAGAAGGGAILLDEGTYNLSRPVTIRQSGVCIRGAGNGAGGTLIDFDYSIPFSPGVEFLTPQASGTIGPDSAIQLQCNPASSTGQDLKEMRILVKLASQGGNGSALKLYTKTSSEVNGNIHALDLTGNVVMNYLGITSTPTDVTLTAQVKYVGDVNWKEASITVTADPSFVDTANYGTWFDLGAIRFAGDGRGDDSRLLTEDGERGDTVLHVDSTSGLSVGDYIYLEAPATAAWKDQTDNAVTGSFLDDHFRVNVYLVTAISGNDITINQPLRIPFPVADGSYIQFFHPVEGCGIEDLDITHSSDLWFSSVYFQAAVNCWMRDVDITDTGKHPYYSKYAKWCEVRDCVFDGSHFNGGGGSAYVGWELGFDNLVEYVHSIAMRHAPNVQWGSAGNVFRNCYFENTDGQCHAGWAHENLIEKCYIISDMQYSSDGIGGSGHGFYSTFPNDASHGPNGPRNVLYNNVILADKRGIVNGGMNEGWLINYNYIRAGNGLGLEYNWGAFDHVVKGNIIVVNSSSWPAVQTYYPDCQGLELIDNDVYSNSGLIFKGVVEPEVNTGNSVHPLNETPDEQLGETAPPVTSIYGWQQSL